MAMAVVWRRDIAMEEGGWRKERGGWKDFGVSMFKKNYDHLPKDTYFGNYKDSVCGNPNYFLTYENVSTITLCCYKDNNTAMAASVSIIGAVKETPLEEGYIKNPQQQQGFLRKLQDFGDR
ncbi:hypothetical protein Ahy_B02g059584 [Arachis hypogaea]|uniref:Uncharacterized protein n=1 Tax=Arachis hypogaea TaxID=3818 RepID=A0A445AGW0_ARAHY|nr:hypothetical protein Ahy_B02g059584 [Arachis hypogaea]